MKIKNSIDFYSSNWPLLVRLLQVDKTQCIHHGYYEKGIRTHVQSVLNMNDFVGRLLNLNSEDKKPLKVLDAGCGIGGTVIYLAKKHPHIDFTGINIVIEHVEMAKNLARENKVLTNTNFILRDFTDTGFPSNRFDAIYLIESACYAEKKQILIRELYRILKPGGIVIIIDVFLTDVQLNPFLNNIYNLFCKGWGLTNLIKTTEFKELLKTEGFNKIINKNLTKNVTRSIIRGDIFCIPYLFSMLIKKILTGKSYKIEQDKYFPSIVSLLTTLLGLKKGISYNVFTAIK